MYELTDKVVDTINDVLIERFSRLKSLISMDEINALQSVNVIYSEVNNIVRKEFLRLAKKTFSENTSARSDIIDEYWLDVVLDEYDPVTKFVYSNEYDRRRARLFEALVSSKTREQEIDRALKSLVLLFRQYAIKVTDKAIILALLQDGIEYVKWNAEEDDRTCKICIHRDGRIYSITNIPDKPHFNCRCWIERATVSTAKKIPFPKSE